MEELANNIASAGDLSSCSPDMRILLYVFIFTFVATLFMSMIGFIKNIG